MLLQKLVPQATHCFRSQLAPWAHGPLSLAIFAQQKPIEAQCRYRDGNSLEPERALMKTILSLHDETTEPTKLLHNTVRAALQFRETKAVAGCNCDRWGHPCPGCHEPKVQPDAGRVISPQPKETTQKWNT